MHITVFGANGRVGSLVVAEALRRGHRVRAFTHRQSALAPHENLEIRQGDIYDASAVAAALDGAEAVISALGSWGTPKKDVLSAGMQAIVPAMTEQGIRRIISLTGHDARHSVDALGLIHRFSHFLLNILAPKILADGETHLQLLEASELDFTVVRSPVMNNLGDPEACQLTAKRPLPWATINRTSVAHTMVELVGTAEYTRQAPYIIRTKK